MKSLQYLHLKRFTNALSVTIFASISNLAMANMTDFRTIMTPSALGQNVKVMNEKYHLKLELVYEDSYYGNLWQNPSDDCSSSISTNSNNIIESITVATLDECHYQIHSNVFFDSKKTNILDILNQVKLADVQVVVGCFNCPSRIEIRDHLDISRPQDNYDTSFDIGSYNDRYKHYIIKSNFPEFDSENLDSYWEYHSKMDSITNSISDFFDKEYYKIQAFKSYDLTIIPASYTISIR